MYTQTDTKYGQGSSYYIAKNPDFGATFTYFLKESPKTLKEKRHEKEKELFKKGERIPQPSETELRAEQNEIVPYLTFTVTDESGNVVRKINTKPSEGINRITWDLRYQGTYPVRLNGEKSTPRVQEKAAHHNAWKNKVPFRNGEWRTKNLTDALNLLRGAQNTSLPDDSRSEMVAFEKKSAELGRIVWGTKQFTDEFANRVQLILQALNNTPGASPELMKQAQSIAAQLDDILFTFNGKTPKASDEENPPAPVPLNWRLSKMAWSHWGSTSNITQTQKDAYSILLDEFTPVYQKVKTLYNVDLKSLEEAMNKEAVPYTTGRLPDFK